MTQNAGGGNSPNNPDAFEDSPAPEEPSVDIPEPEPQAAGQDGGEPEADAAATEQQEEIEALRAQANENHENYLRVVAELENLRKRSARDVENARNFGMERLANGVLPVRDSLEAALDASTNADVPVTVDTMIEGEQGTLQVLNQALENAGIREIDPQGERFDPNKHEAMTTQPSAELPPDMVAVVVQKGYELNERLLRPARVIVSAPVEDASG